MGLTFFRGLLAHKLRALLTALAVAIGVALMAGTYILTDTMNASYTQLVDAAFGSASSFVLPAQPLGQGNQAQTSPIGEAMVRKVRATPGVSMAAGEILADATIIGPSGKVIGSPSSEYVVNKVPPALELLRPVRGHFPASSGEVAVDENTAARFGLRLGETIGVTGAGSVHRYRLVGTVRLLGSSSFAGAGVALLTTPQAQQVAGETSRYDEIGVIATKGVTPAQIRARLAAELPKDVMVRTGAEEAASLASSFSSDIGFFKDFLLAFSYVALFVGGFVVLNTFSVTVGQKTRELAILRALGASRRQVLGTVVGESALLGLAGGLAGLGLGTALAPGLDAAFKALGVDVPDNGVVLLARTFIVSLVAGVGVALLAGLAPALRATRVPPVAAMREGAAPQPRRSARRRVFAGTAVILFGAGLMALGLAGGAGIVLGAGALAFLAGVALFLPSFVPALAAFAGAAVSWRGVTGRLAKENARRQPGRTAVTSAALMIGVALVTFTAVIATGTKATVDSAVKAAFAGNLVVQPSGSSNQGVPAPLATALTRVPGVAVVAPVAFSEARVAGVSGTQGVAGVTPALAELYRVKWVAGPSDAIAKIGPGEAVLTKEFASEHHFHVGNTLRLLTVSGQHLRLVVTAIASDRANLLDAVNVARPVLEADFSQQNDGVDFVGFAHGASAGVVQSTVDHLLEKGFPEVSALSEAQFESQVANSVNSILDLVYVLLALAIVVSLLGLVNTLALAVHERRRELGLLRAVGASRAQVRQVVRYESVVTALIGALSGLVLGAASAAVLGRWLGGAGFVLSFPLGSMALFLVLAGIAGVVAAVMPARHAARLEILDAVATG